MSSNKDIFGHNGDNQETLELLKHITEQDFLGLGIHDVAYIKPVDIEGTTQFAIHAADGTTLSVLKDKSCLTIGLEFTEPGINL